MSYNFHLRLIFLALALLVSNALAEDALMEDGRSPNGRYEVRISRILIPDSKYPTDSYSIHIYEKNKEKPISTLSVSGDGSYLRYEGAKERCHAFWHSSSEFIVITDQGTRHSTEIEIFSICNGQVEKLEIPDYPQNAFGRVNALYSDFISVNRPKSWNGDDLFLDYYFSANGRKHYDAKVILHLWHGKNLAPRIELKSIVIKNPEGEEG